jgi:hypothetical protein
MKKLFTILSIFALFAAQPVFSSDLSITAASVATSSPDYRIPVVYGETVTAGKVVYRSSSDGRYYLADCTVQSKASPAGITLSGGGAGQPGYICAEDPLFTPGATLSTSAPVYVLSTAGGIAPIADLAANDYCVVLFVTTNSTGTKAAFSVRGHASTTLTTSP